VNAKASAWSTVSVAAASVFFAFTHFAVAQLSPLAELPDWGVLDRYQRTIEKKEFIARLTRFSPDGFFLKACDISDEQLVVFRSASKTERLWQLEFGTLPSHERTLNTKSSTEKKGVSSGSVASSAPLSGLVVCLDPGHLGGEWARLEERHFQVGQDAPVQEWDLNLKTCLLIEKGLQALGARVVWSKTDTQPVTWLRPVDLRGEVLHAIFNERFFARHLFSAQEDGVDDGDLFWGKIEKRSQLLFYRVAEIRARAQKINTVLKPDITLCVHFNAGPWGDPMNPRLIEKNRLVLFAHGAYMENELAYEDMKFDLLRKLLEGSGDNEEGLALSIAQHYEKIWPWMPEDYKDWASVIPHKSNPYVFFRNLIANRLIDGPVVFCEGPYMNAREIYPRLQAGDYDGEQIIHGRIARSIFREFADAVVGGVRDYYGHGKSSHRN